MYCEKCGLKLDEDARFCPKCGHACLADEMGQNNLSFEREEADVEKRKIVYRNELTDEEIYSQYSKVSRTNKKRNNIIIVILLVLAVGVVVAKKIDWGKISLEKFTSSKPAVDERVEQTLIDEQSEVDEREVTEEEPVSTESSTLIVTEDFKNIGNEKYYNIMDKMDPERRWLEIYEDDYDGDSLFEAFILAYTDEEWNTKQEFGYEVIAKVWFVSTEMQSIVGSEWGDYCFDAEIVKLTDGTKAFKCNTFYSSKDTQSMIFTVENGKAAQKGLFVQASVDERGNIVESGSYYSRDNEYPKHYEYRNGAFVYFSTQNTIEVDSQVEEIYKNNLIPNEYKNYQSEITNFKFSYPVKLYNKVKINKNKTDHIYGKNIETIEFKGSEGSRLVFSLAYRTDYNTTEDFTAHVYESESKSLVEPQEVVYTSDKENGRVILTGWDPKNPDAAIYDMVKVEPQHVMQMKVYLSPYSSEEDRILKAYYVECLYRLCGFSGTQKEVRTYEEYLANN